MPLQNRVHPDGTLHAVHARGTMMGNRGGRIHTDDRTLTRRRWASKAWICCALAFRDRQRSVMGLGYTEVFFLDEATALAAGHRPCFECRRAEARAFAAAFADGGAPPRAGAMDTILHEERRSARSVVAVADLPAGAMVADGAGPLLITEHGLRRWFFSGYAPTTTNAKRATLLTPPAIVAALRAGYRPRLHPSVEG